jgi:hypothetical protein
VPALAPAKLSVPTTVTELTSSSGPTAGMVVSPTRVTFCNVAAPPMLAPVEAITPPSTRPSSSVAPAPRAMVPKLSWETLAPLRPNVPPAPICNSPELTTLAAERSALLPVTMRPVLTSAPSPVVPLVRIVPLLVNAPLPYWLSSSNAVASIRPSLTRTPPPALMM